MSRRITGCSTDVPGRARAASFVARAEHDAERAGGRRDDAAVLRVGRRGGRARRGGRGDHGVVARLARSIFRDLGALPDLVRARSSARRRSPVSAKAPLRSEVRRPTLRFSSVCVAASAGSRRQRRRPRRRAAEMVVVVALARAFCDIVSEVCEEGLGRCDRRVDAQLRIMQTRSGRAANVERQANSRLPGSCQGQNRRCRRAAPSLTAARRAAPN